jgi:hypothetical protein
MQTLRNFRQVEANSGTRGRLCIGLSTRRADFQAQNAQPHGIRHRSQVLNQIGAHADVHSTSRHTDFHTKSPRAGTICRDLRALACVYAHGNQDKEEDVRV